MKIDPRLKEELKKYLKEKIKKESEKVVVTSPYKLSREELSALVSKIPELKKHEIIEKVDPALIAGMTIRKGSKIVDLSLSTMIKNLEEASYESLG